MFIEFGILNIKLLILLFYPTGVILGALLNSSYSLLYNYFILYSGFLLAGIIYLIILIRTKRINNTKFSVNASLGSAVNQIEQQQKEEKKKKKIKERTFIFLLALLNFLPDWVNFFLSQKINSISNTYSINIASLLIFYCYIFFSKLILHEKIHIHRVFSIIIISICFLILFINCEFFEFKIGSFSILLIYSFCTSGIGALFSVLVKLHFNTYLTDPYLFIFYLGLVPLLFLIPIDIVYYFGFDGNNKILGKAIILKVKSNSENFLKNLVYSILLMLVYLFTYGSQTLVTYHFTPSHFIIPLMIEIAKNVIINKNGNFGARSKIVFFVAIIIMAFFLLVYNEVIIIKLCSLEKYTAKYISKRQKTEYEKLDHIKIDDRDEKLNDSIDNIISANE